MQVVYSRERKALKRGQRFQNPRFFDGPISGVSRVLLDGDYPKISAAYAAAGVEVIRTDPIDLVNFHPLAGGPSRQLKGVIPPHEPGAVVIPDDWQELPWTQRAGHDGTTLRALASAISDAPVVNKADAIEIIETELKRRG